MCFRGENDFGSAGQRMRCGDRMRCIGALCERNIMNTVVESVLTVCVVLISTELLRKICPENQMVSFVGD